MDYSKDYNNLPDEDSEERDAIGQLAEENAAENELERQRELWELKKLMAKHTDKIVGILKELNNKHNGNRSWMEINAQEMPRFKRTEIKDN